MADISLIPGDTLWACACGERWVENGEGDQDMPAECGRCGGKMIVTGRFSEGAAISSDPRTLDLIMWSLRLPLLRGRVEALQLSPVPHEQIAYDNRLAELARLDALIAEGERALGILPEEEAS